MRTLLLLVTCAVLLPAQAQQPSAWELQERHEREKRELKRQQKAIEAAQAKAAREAERQRRAEEKAAQQAARDRQRTIDTAIRTGGKVASSRLGQDILRGVFGTLFGGGKSR